MLGLTRLTECTPISYADISAIQHSAYRDYVRQDRLSLVRCKLVVFQPAQNNTELLMLLISLSRSSLRRDIFSAYHAWTGHMGIY